MTTEAITDLNALALSHAIHARQVSCVEVMRGYLARIHRLNPSFTAIVNPADDDVLLAQAAERDTELSRGQSRGWMHGMPQAIKDATAAKGFPTTCGSPLLKDAVARVDSIVAERMKAAGCIVIGKTNLSEFGLGSHTYNNLFGATGNAWDTSVSAGGSSGGAAVCLAQRMLPVADGSDYMGSLRNPAAWNNVFGMRPSQGRVPYWPAMDVWVQQLATAGPMGRTVRDVAQLLSTQAGYDQRAPLSIAQGPQILVPGPGAEVRGKRIGWLGHLNGHLATEKGVLDVCAHALRRMESAGAVVEPLDSIGVDLDSVWQAWLVWRWALVAPSIGAVMTTPAARAQVKPEAQWEYDQAQSLRVGDFMRASQVRSQFYAAMTRLFERFDALALPAAQVWPFPTAEHWPKSIEGRTMDTYHRWMEATIYATFAGLPAISVPAGFHPNGRWPMGLQLIGPPQGDAALLDLAAGYETLIHDLLMRRPPEPAGAKTPDRSHL
jgi:amidase